MSGPSAKSKKAVLVELLTFLLDLLLAILPSSSADLLNAIQVLSQLSYTPTYLYPLCRKGFGILEPVFIRFSVGALTGYCALPAELYPHVIIQ